MIRVLVCAHSADELAEIAEVVREDDSLRLVGSSLDRARLGELAEDADPDVLLECWRADDSDDTDAVAFFDPPVARVLLVVQAEFADALRAMRSSETAIRGVLPAWSSDGEIRAAIEAVAEGLLVLHPEVADHAPGGPVPRHREAHAADRSLSPRESEILNLLGAGLGNKQIAAELNISEHTVKFHLTSIFNKLDASSRAEAVAIGARRGLIIL